MGKISASSSTVVAAAPEKALAAVSDYATVRPRILSEHYGAYQVVSGGTGDGTVAEWTFAPRSNKPPRNVKATVSVSGNTVTETDANSTLITTWTVAPSGTGSQITTTTEWTSAASGIGGFMEKTFAPGGTKKIQEQVLANLRTELDK